jgi:WD40 repeat protein
VCLDDGFSAVQDTVFHYSGMDGTVQTLDLKSGELATSLTLPSQVQPVVLPRPIRSSQNLECEFSSNQNIQNLLIFIFFLIRRQNFPVLAVNESCTRLVISTKKGNDTYAIEQYDFQSGQLVRSIDCHSGWITCLHFLNENHVVTGSQGIYPLLLACGYHHRLC